MKLSHLELASLADLEAGDLFFSLEEHMAPFVAGSIADTPVKLTFAPEMPFHVGQTWPAQRGLLIREATFEVDLSSVKLRLGERDCVHGELLRFNGGFGMLGTAEHGQHVVVLGGEMPADGAVRFVAFSSWTLGVGSGQDRSVIICCVDRRVRMVPDRTLSGL
jgi:hypothetical protein